MASKTMKDWFLRGGERPKGKLPDPPDEIPADDGEDFDDGVIDCPHCGGENLASEEYCTHCGQSLYDDDDEEAV